MSERLLRTLRDPAWRRDAILAVLLLALGVAGLLHVAHGSWRPGPGGGNHLVPMLLYWVMIGTALIMILPGARPGGDEELGLRANLLPVLLATVAAGLYFLAVYRIGIAVSTAAFLAAAVAVLSPSPRRELPRILIVAVVGGAAFWVLFTLLAPIVTVRQLLF